MFPTAYFPPGYFAPDYWPRPGVGAPAPTPVGAPAVGGRRASAAHLILLDEAERGRARLRDRLRQARLAELTRLAYEADAARHRDYLAGVAYSVLIAEL